MKMYKIGFLLEIKRYGYEQYFFLFNFDDFFRHFFSSHCIISGNISNIIKVKSCFVVFFYRPWSIIRYINTTRAMNLHSNATVG